MSDRPTGEERIADPLSHFPYKQDEAHAGAVRELRRQVRMLELPDEQAEQALFDALLPFAADQVDATAAYVAAQEAYFREPSGDTRAAERAAADQLTEARRAYRDGRDKLSAGAHGASEGA